MHERVITGQRIVEDLQGFHEGMMGLVDLLEDLRGLGHPDAEGLTYDHEMYLESANAAGITSFILEKARSKRLQLVQYNLDEPLDVRNGFDMAMYFITDAVADTGKMVEEISEDELRALMLGALEGNINKGREMDIVFGFDPADEVSRTNETANVRSFGILAQFIKEALEV